MAVQLTNYQRNVFINCPFDAEYRPLFYAIAFAVADCGFAPRCALEADDSGDVRIRKIMAIIEQCCYGIHDISRTETTLFPESDGRHEALPRFNMPLELGIFIGSQRFGDPQQAEKKYLIFDTKKYRYQKFISDLAGQDIKAHQWDNQASASEQELAIGRVVAGVRDWLNPKRGDAILPGGRRMTLRFAQFRQEMPALASEFGQHETDLTFYDLTGLMQTWLVANA